MRPKPFIPGLQLPALKVDRLAADNLPFELKPQWLVISSCQSPQKPIPFAIRINLLSPAMEHC